MICLFLFCAVFLSLQFLSATPSYDAANLKELSFLPSPYSSVVSNCLEQSRRKLAFINSRTLNAVSQLLSLFGSEWITSEVTVMQFV
jgi:hypothetical protein